MDKEKEGGTHKGAAVHQWETMRIPGRKEEGLPCYLADYLRIWQAIWYSERSSQQTKFVGNKSKAQAAALTTLA